MSKYNLNELGDEKFEDLCQSLLKAVIGNGTITFGPGKDGAREATFSGKAPYPSETEPWDGEWIFQVKFHDVDLLGIDKARKEVLSDLKKELDKIVNKYRHNCDNYILITNVPLSSVYKTGNHDQIACKIIPEYLEHISHIHIWGADDLYGFLDKYINIRSAFNMISLVDWIEMKKERIDENNEINKDTILANANFPDIPEPQIPRDTLVRSIAKKFSPNCRMQMVTGAHQTGKTNFMSQFARQYDDNAFYYFITSSPLTQSPYTFLYSLCQQLSIRLEKRPPTHQLDLERLKSMTMERFNILHRKSKVQRLDYYLIIDGLEWAIDGPEGNRIIDLFPLPSTPYMLVSCRSDRTDMLPEYFQCQQIEPDRWAFEETDAREYFGDLLPLNKVTLISLVLC